MATITDPTTDLGTDINVVSDLAPVWGLASGPTNLINALLRRLTTPRGGLFYDPNYGFDVVALVNSAVTPVDVARIKAGVAAELQKDDRVQSANVQADFVFATKTLTLNIKITTADGPFDLVLSASAVTVDLLSVNGVAVTAPPTPAAVSVVVGAPGPAGPAGPTGPAGSGGGGTPQLSFADSKLVGDNSGGEVVLFQWDGADFGTLGATLTAELGASVFSASGTATFKLRIGGSDGVADGTVIAPITQATAAFQEKTATATFSNPTGVLFVKVTGQSSAAAVDAQARNPTVTFR